MRTEPETTLRLLRTTAELEQVAFDWRTLWHKDQNASPFAHPAWLLPWWSAFGQPDLRVLSLWRGESLEALLPLYVLHLPEEAQLLLLGAGTSDYLDALVAPGCTDRELRHLLREALAAQGWDAAHLTQLRPGSRLRQAMVALQGMSDMPCVATVEPYAGESCSSCAAAPVAAMPSRLRSDVRYFRNAAIGHGKLVLVESTAEELGWSFDLLVRLHTESWQQRGEPGVLADPLVLAHHREALPLLLEAGLLRLMRLELAGEPIAVLYALADPPDRPQRTLYLYLMGYATAHQELRPGMLLTALCSEYAAQNGFHTLDMLRGHEAYKQFWRVEPRPTFGFRILPRRAEP